jgi:GTP1/Obg family GTP-binding protein
MSDEFKKHLSNKKSAGKKIDALSTEYIDSLAKVHHDIAEVKESISIVKS